MAAAIRIPKRFNGPPDSANGGYTCGLVAGLLGDGPAEVILRSPPPLERELAVQDAQGGLVVRDGETVVAEGRSAELRVEPPQAVTPDGARAASERGLEHWSSRHPFPTCVVCGPARAHGDGLRIFPGEIGEGRFAASWTPDPSVAGPAGQVRPECIWAALDCPTSAPVANYGKGPPVVLGRLAASIQAPVCVGRPHALVSWELGREGRKREAACVLVDARGHVLARSRALWIELAQE